MIARLWRGRASCRSSGCWPGTRGAWLLRREVDGEAEFLALTLWDSLGAIRSFAGDAVETAIVEPQARAVLSDFDGFARHYEVAFKS